MEIGIRQAKADFSKLVERAQSGEEIVITKRGKPVAVLSGSVRTPRPQRRPGRLRHWAKYDAILERPWSEEELDEFAGGLTDEFGIVQPHR